MQNFLKDIPDRSLRIHANSTETLFTNKLLFAFAYVISGHTHLFHYPGLLFFPLLTKENHEPRGFLFPLNLLSVSNMKRHWRHNTIPRVRFRDGFEADFWEKILPCQERLIESNLAHQLLSQQCRRRRTLVQSSSLALSSRSGAVTRRGCGLVSLFPAGCPARNLAQSNDNLIPSEPRTLKLLTKIDSFCKTAQF